MGDNGGPGRCPGGETLRMKNLTTGHDLPVACELTERQRLILLAGGLLNYIREGGR